VSVPDPRLCLEQIEKENHLCGRIRDGGIRRKYGNETGCRYRIGIFGFNIVKDLYEVGFDVIAIDKSKDAIQRVKDCSTKAILADGLDGEVMDMIGFRKMTSSLFPSERIGGQHPDHTAYETAEDQEYHC
jgi:hypothetical protein